MTAARAGRSLRARLTLWYTAAVGALLAVLGATAFVLLDRGLRTTVDVSLVSVARAVAESARETSPLGPRVDDLLASLLGPSLAERFFQLLDPLGRPDPRVAPRGSAALPLSPIALANAQAGRETFETVALPSVAAPVRVLTYPVVEAGRTVNVVRVAMPLTIVETTRRRFLAILLGLAPLAVGGAAAGVWIVTGRALAPVDRMVAAARRIGADDLSQRLAAPGRDDELGRLAAVLNEMLGRLETSFAAARQFSADAAHELRTPLTILKGEIEVALRTAQGTDDYRRALESGQEEVDRLIALVEDLLLLARIDAEAAPLPRERVDLAAVIDDAAPALRALAEQAQVTLAVDRAAPVEVQGSAPMLFRVVLNLADNAVKHAGVGHHVEVSLGMDGTDAVLTVRDDGPGIPAADLPHVFDRFYRADPARQRAGAGLGLALVRSIVALHAGRVTVESAPGRGTCVRVYVPRG